MLLKHKFQKVYHLKITHQYPIKWWLTKSILGYFNSTIFKIFKCFKWELCERDFVQMPADRMDLWQFGTASSIVWLTVSLFKEGFCDSNLADQLLYVLLRWPLTTLMSKSTANSVCVHLQHYDVWRTLQIHTENVFDHVIFQVAREKKKNTTTLTQLNVGLRLSPLLATYLSLVLAPLIIPRQWSPQDRPFLLNTLRKHSLMTTVDKGVY